ncbi:MAG: PAC2 family protein, partial [Phycisphaerales bacterium]
SYPRVLLGFSGWMDGGDVSTGTINLLIEKLGAEKIAEIKPDSFYLYSFPGSMELTALFRPHTRIKEGLIKSYELPTNMFFCSEKDNLILFNGKEPNINWSEFADCIFELCNKCGVRNIYFIGSVAGLVPHTREPRLFCSVSNPQLKDKLVHYGVKFSNYEGPASIVTYLTSRATEYSVDMVSFVSAIPAYVQGYNPKCIEAVIRRLAGILELQIDLDNLRVISDSFEKKLSNVVQEQPELADRIRKLEEDYDNEIFNNEMGDLKKWLQEKGVRLD